MKLAPSVRRLCFAMTMSAAGLLAFQAQAQDVSDAHLKAARAAIAAMDRTDGFDNILPQAANALKAQLIQQNPNLEALIVATVDEKSLALAGRRGDLEREVALAYARVFPEADLNAIAAFFNSAAGKKLIADEPAVMREVAKAADIWQRGIARDLSVEVAKHLQQVMGAQAKPAPEAGATPAPEGAAPPETPTLEVPAESLDPASATPPAQ